MGQLPLLQTSTVKLNRDSTKEKLDNGERKGNKANEGKKVEKKANDTQGKGKNIEGGKADAQASAKVEAGKNDKVQVGKEAAASQDFTTAQDEKLREMKTGNKSWKEIETDTGKPKFDLQTRWKELQALNKGEGGTQNETKDGNAKGDGQKKELKKDTGDSKPTGQNNQATTNEAGKKGEHGKETVAVQGVKKDMGKQKGQQQNGEQKDKSKAQTNTKGKAGKNVDIARAVEAQEQTLTLTDLTLLEDSQFDAADLRRMLDIRTALAYDGKPLAMAESEKGEEYWGRVTSRFYDRTGRWVHWEDIRAKFKD